MCVWGVNVTVAGFTTHSHKGTHSFSARAQFGRAILLGKHEVTGMVEREDISLQRYEWGFCWAGEWGGGVVRGWVVGRYR